jgi:hypothetical protein
MATIRSSQTRRPSGRPAVKGIPSVSSNQNACWARRGRRFSPSNNTRPLAAQSNKRDRKRHLCRVFNDEADAVADADLVGRAFSGLHLGKGGILCRLGTEDFLAAVEQP